MEGLFIGGREKTSWYVTDKAVLGVSATNCKIFQYSFLDVSY